ncbi:MAG: flotillin [Rhodobacteraceae bacterium]|nr:flotillin [Paracoccaceae bacterium]
MIVGIIFPAAVILVAILVTGFAFSRMYKRSTREVSLVKTGAGGKKVVVDGGTLVIPVLHEVTKVNMRTTRLEVRRTGKDALITRDRQRADVGVEFYVTVESTEEGISRAAQTLGNRTFNEGALREMVEGKLVDGLRSVAAQMNLDDLHENRSNFVQQVQQTVIEDLKKNGLELESVSLTALDQTPTEGLDENNIFNSEGLRYQAERIAESRKKRAAIEAEAEVSVARSKQEAEVQTYEIQREQEAARVDQRVQMEQLAARESSERARNKEEAERAAEEARIDREKRIEIAEQDRKIAVAEKSREESQARAEADTAKAEAIKATASIDTARLVAEGERQKRLTIIAAEEEAERKATEIRVAAKAERDTAADRAAAMRVLAEAEAAQITIRAEAAKAEKLTEAERKAAETRVAAKAERDAAADRAAAMRELAAAEAAQITIRAEAVKTEKLAEAEGLTALNAAENSASAQIIDFRMARARLEALPKIVAEMVKPAEKIKGITIHKVDGLGTGAVGGTASGPAGGGDGIVNQAFDEIRKMAFQLPAIQAIGKQVGMNMNGTFSDLVDQALQTATDGQTAPAADTSGGPAEASGPTTDDGAAV